MFINRNKTTNVVVILALLLSLLPTSIMTAQTPIETLETLDAGRLPAIPAFSSYLLTLPMPEVQLAPQVVSADVPGYYHAALADQWAKVGDVLSALQQVGSVESYTLLPRANAFQVSFRPDALDQVQNLGSLSPSGREPQAVETRAGLDRFQAQLQALIQDAQENIAAQEMVVERPVLRLSPPQPEERLVTPSIPTVPLDYDHTRPALLAYTPTTPTVDLSNDGWIYPQSHIDTTTVFTLTTSARVVKDIVNLCSVAGPGCDSMWAWNGSSWYAFVSIDWSVPIDAGHILYVH
ncbi:MAG: hypothetical protein EHM70_20500, partial [Chloroflexota bacterium]